MKNLALSTCLGLLFSFFFLQNSMAQPRASACGLTPKFPVCATPVCLGGAWEPVPKARGIGCKDTHGVAGMCDGTDIECSLPCPDNTAFVAPKYYVLSLIYSPPGCTSTSSYRCPGTGSVDYGQGASLSTKTVNSDSLDQKYNFSVDTSFTLDKIFKLGGGVSGGWGTTSTDTNSQTISSSGSLDIKVNGNNDGVDHDQDTFFLLLNPAVALKAGASGSTLEGCAPTLFNWQVALFGSQTLETYTLTVAQLKNPQLLPPNVANVLIAHGFMANDYADILTLDPFAQGQTTVDPVRFAATTWTLPYEPPSTGSNCPGGVCSCLSYVETLKNDFQSGITKALKSDYNVGITESAGIDKKDGTTPFSVTVKSTQTFTWSNSSSKENDTGGSQSASATINCPSPAYTQPTDATMMLVYWDRLFGTFLFVPALTVSAQQPIHQGFLMQAGQPAVHVPVQITIAGKTYHTLTDGAGKYVFYGPAAAVQKGLLSVGGQQFQLPLAPTAPATLDIQ